MKVLLMSVVLLQAWCNDCVISLPKPNGVATYTYQDSTGKRYGGTYGLGDSVSPFSDPIISPYREAYIPEFFNNFGGILQQFPFGGFPFGGFGAFNMDRLSHNSAFSSAGIGPGYTHQSAIINPPNAANPNVDITDRYAEPEGGPGNFYSVSSSSFASSNNDNGKVSGFRGAETVVNNNGKVTKYRVHS